VEGNPFSYAHDFLDLYSTSIDISNGLPNPITANLAIANPAKDTYGKAAAEILSSAPWYITTIPSANVTALPNIGAVYAGSKMGKFAYGFVAKSQICRYSNGTEKYVTGSYHYEYRLENYLHPYEKLTLKGIKIALSNRTAEAETELANFVNFLTGNGVTIGTDIIRTYCYKLPKN
jgi:molybdate transport system substrate-binding protein